MKRILITIGIPSSGKSTYADNLQKQVNPNKSVRINNDDLREEIFGDAGCHDNESLVWRINHNRFELALQDNNITHIIVDKTHPTFKSRKEYYKIIEQNDMVDDVIIHIVYIKTSVEKSLKMQEGRDRKVSKEIIEKMQNTLDSNCVFSIDEIVKYDCRVIQVDPESSCGFSDVI